MERLCGLRVPSAAVPNLDSVLRFSQHGEVNESKFICFWEQILEQLAPLKNRLLSAAFGVGPPGARNGIAAFVSSGLCSVIRARFPYDSRPLTAMPFGVAFQARCQAGVDGGPFRLAEGARSGQTS